MDDDLDVDEPAADVVQRLADDPVLDELPDDVANGDLSDLQGGDEDTGAADDADDADDGEPRRTAGGHRLTDAEVDAMEIAEA
jgi:hypothetical protein